MSLVLALVPAAAFAGCVSNEAEPKVAATSPLPTEGSKDAAGNVLTSVQKTFAPPKEVTYYLTSQKGLAFEKPSASQMTVGSSYVKCIGLSDCGLLYFESTPLTNRSQIEAKTVKVTLWLQSDVPLLSSQFLDFGAYFGSTRTAPLGTTTVHSAPILPGAPAQVDIAIDFGKVIPIVVNKGESLRLGLVIGMMQEGTGVVKLLFGDPSPTSVTFTTGEIAEDGPALASVPTETKETGEIVLPAFAVGDPAGMAAKRHSVKVLSTSSYLEVVVKQTGGVRNPADIDMQILDGADVISGGYTPLNTEKAYLAGKAFEALRDKTLTIVVTNFAGVNTAYDLAAKQG